MASSSKDCVMDCEKVCEEVIPTPADEDSQKLLDVSWIGMQDCDLDVEMSLMDDYFAPGEELYPKLTKEEHEKKLAEIEKKSLEYQVRSLNWRLKKTELEKEVEADRLKEEIFKNSPIGIATKKYRDAVEMTKKARKILEEGKEVETMLKRKEDKLYKKLDELKKAKALSKKKTSTN